MLSTSDLGRVAALLEELVSIYEADLEDGDECAYEEAVHKAGPRELADRTREAYLDALRRECA